MAHSERSKRGGRQGHWRRRQQRWNGPESFHHDDRGPVFQQYDGLASQGALRPGPRALHPVGRADGHLRALDQLSLRHMAQDCTSVKNQLLKLKTLLQLEDGAVWPDVEEDTQDNTTTLQLEELMKEVMVLREELRMKDKTIAQLTHQQQQQQEVSGQQQERGRCVCHQRAPSLQGGDRRTHYDKATQTPWRGGQGHGPPVLQPSSPCPRERLLQGRLARAAPTEVLSDPQPSPSVKRGTQTHTASPGGPLPPDPDELSLLLSTQLHLHVQAGSGTSQGGSQGSSSPAQGAISGLERERKAPAGSVASCPRVLQPPRLYRRVCVPALLRGGSALTTGPAGQRASHMTQHLPPPSRGLPCFNSGPQGLGVVRHPKHRTIPRRGPDPGMEEPDLTPPQPGSRPPPTLSLLPKPKIHSPAQLVPADDSSMTVPSVSMVHTPLTG